MLPGLSDKYSQSEIDSVTLEDYSNIRLDHLNEIEFGNFTNFKSELEFVKLIRAKAPMLKKVKIFIYSKVDKDEELKLLRILLQSPRTSLEVKISVERRV